MDDAKKPLFAKYSRLLNGIDEERCGFHVGNGWLPLVEAVLYGIQWEIDGLPEGVKGDFCVDQIKEKFGGLRFYMNKTTPTMQEIIIQAEAKSHTICELCGTTGSIRNMRGWLKTYCDSCAAAKKA